MQEETPLELEQRNRAARRREQALAAIQRFRPLSVWGQTAVLSFELAMVLLVTFASFLAPLHNPTQSLSVVLVVMIFFVAGNAMRTQRRLGALIELVMQDLDRSKTATPSG